MSGLYRKLRANGLIIRLLLIPVFVAVCHLYSWMWLRVLTTITLVKLSEALGIPMYRVGLDLAQVAGVTVQFVVSCTMIDAFCGAIPLLWRATISWPQNLARLALVFAGVFVLNIVRLELGFIVMTKGVPWWLAHECVAGVAYFCLYAFIVQQRGWAGEQSSPLMA